jgi:hypothetical protein
LERYQEALHVDRLEPGQRDSSERWALIAPYLPASGIVLDVGSNLGFFGLSAVTEHPDVAVVSIEASARIAELQRRLLAERGTTRICLVRGALDSATARTWAETCDWFQLTLLLSILHWMDDPAAVLRALSAMSASLILEIPDGNDRGACGRSNVDLWGEDPVGWVASQTSRPTALLGRIGRHTSDVPSHLIHVGGPVTRQPKRPYWGYDFDRREPHNYRIEYDGATVALAVGQRPVDYRPGVNLLSLMRLGTLLHPPADWWRADAARELDASPKHGDPYPHNMLWTERGLVLVDDDDLEVERSRGEVLASFNSNLAAWERGRTRRYVREVLGPRRLARRIVGRIARRVLGDPFVERVKTRLEGPRRAG